MGQRMDEGRVGTPDSGERDWAVRCSRLRRGTVRAAARRAVPLYRLLRTPWPCPAPCVLRPTSDQLRSACRVCRDTRESVMCEDCRLRGCDKIAASYLVWPMGGGDARCVRSKFDRRSPASHSRYSPFSLHFRLSALALYTPSYTVISV